MKIGVKKRDDSKGNSKSNSPTRVKITQEMMKQGRRHVSPTSPDLSNKPAFNVEEIKESLRLQIQEAMESMEDHVEKIKLD